MPSVAQSRRIYATTRTHLAKQRAEQQQQNGGNVGASDDGTEPKQKSVTFAGVCKMVVRSTHEANIITDMLSILGATTTAAVAQKESEEIVRQRTIEMLAVRELLAKLGAFKTKLGKHDIKASSQVIDSMNALKTTMATAHQHNNLLQILDRLDELHSSLSTMKAWFDSDELRELSTAIRDVSELQMSQDYLRDIARKYSDKKDKKSMSKCSDKKTTKRSKSDLDRSAAQSRLYEAKSPEGLIGKERVKMKSEQVGRVWRAGTVRTGSENVFAGSYEVLSPRLSTVRGDAPRRSSVRGDAQDHTGQSLRNRQSVAARQSSYFDRHGDFVPGSPKSAGSPQKSSRKRVRDSWLFKGGSGRSQYLDGAPTIDEGSQQDSGEFTIEWSDTWGDDLQEQMEGRRREDYIVLTRNNQVIDPVVDNPDKSSFPLRCIPKAQLTRQEGGSFSIGWSDSWANDLQVQMEGRRPEDYTVLTRDNQVIDPFTKPPDKSSFPLRFIPKAQLTQQEGGSFSIGWSDYWANDIQVQMEGRRPEDYTVLTRDNQVIDPFTEPPDKSSFPLRFIPKAQLTRQDGRLFSIAWSDHWASDLEAQMEGRRREDYIALTRNDQVIDPFEESPDKSSFPIRFIPKVELTQQDDHAFSIAWSDSWTSDLEAQMQGRHREDYITLSKNNQVIDPFLDQLDESSFPLQFIPKAATSQPSHHEVRTIGQVLSATGLRSSRSSLATKGVDDDLELDEFEALVQAIYEAEGEAVPTKGEVRAMFAKAQREGDRRVTMESIGRVFGGGLFNLQGKPWTSWSIPEHLVDAADMEQLHNILHDKVWHDEADQPSIEGGEVAGSSNSVEQAAHFRLSTLLGIHGKHQNKIRAPRSRNRLKFNLAYLLHKANHVSLGFDGFCEALHDAYKEAGQKCLCVEACQELFDSLKEEDGLVKIATLDALASGPLPTEASVFGAEPTQTDFGTPHIAPSYPGTATQPSNFVVSGGATEKSKGFGEYLLTSPANQESQAAAAAKKAAQAMAAAQEFSKSSRETNQRAHFVLPTEFKKQEHSEVASAGGSEVASPGGVDRTHRQIRPSEYARALVGFKTQKRSGDEAAGGVGHTPDSSTDQENRGADANSIAALSDKTLELAQKRRSRLDVMENNSHFLSVIETVRSMQRVREAVTAFKKHPPNTLSPLEASLDDTMISALDLSQWQQEEEAIEDFFIATSSESEDEDGDMSETSSGFVEGDRRQSFLQSQSQQSSKVAKKDGLRRPEDNMTSRPTTTSSGWPSSRPSTQSSGWPRSRPSSLFGPELQDIRGFSHQMLPSLQGSRMSNYSSNGSENPSRPSTGSYWAQNARQQFEKAKQGILPKLQDPCGSGLQLRPGMKLPRPPSASPRGHSSHGRRPQGIHQQPGETFSIEQVVSFRYHRGLRSKIVDEDLQAQFAAVLEEEPRIPCFCGQCLGGCCFEEPVWIA
eukprot:TRINITY_DN4039_c0_g1_i1.p1 TRINITY_DN4039_c0_g1~~TRINITY_DN4039_c0_g1_i1.p1  ORF type:complete len:1448 (-),score=261.13 TRINITY_DN4039_c0_g1_i1:342-4685(-)